MKHSNQFSTGGMRIIMFFLLLGLVVFILGDFGHYARKSKYQLVLTSFLSLPSGGDMSFTHSTSATRYLQINKKVNQFQKLCLCMKWSLKSCGKLPILIPISNDTTSPPTFNLHPLVVRYQMMQKEMHIIMQLAYSFTSKKKRPSGRGSQLHYNRTSDHMH